MKMKVVFFITILGCLSMEVCAGEFREYVTNWHIRNGNPSGAQLVAKLSEKAKNLSSESLWSELDKNGDRNVLFSLYQDGVYELDLVEDYLERYNEIPALVIFYVEEGDLNRLNLKELECLFEKYLIRRLTDFRVACLRNDSATIKLWPGYTGFFLETFPDNIIVRKLLADFPFSPYADPEYVKSVIMPLINKDSRMKAYYQKRVDLIKECGVSLEKQEKK